MQTPTIDRDYPYRSAIGPLTQLKTSLAAGGTSDSRATQDKISVCYERLDQLNQSLEDDQLLWSQMMKPFEVHWITRTLLSTLSKAQSELQDSISSAYRLLESAKNNQSNYSDEYCADLLTNLENLCQLTESVLTLQDQLVKPLAELHIFESVQHSDHSSPTLH